MTVQELLNMYRKSGLYDVMIDISYGGGCASCYNNYSEIPQEDLNEKVNSFSVGTYTGETEYGKVENEPLLTIIVGGGEVFSYTSIRKNTKELFLSKVQGKKPKDIIKVMKEFFSDCVIDTKSDNVKSYASYLYCKENKLV